MDKNNVTTSGSPTGPQDIFIEHLDYEIDEVTNSKYYKLSMISICKLKSLDLEMERKAVKLVSRGKALEIEAYAVESSIKEEVH